MEALHRSGGQVKEHGHVGHLYLTLFLAAILLVAVIAGGFAAVLHVTELVLIAGVAIIVLGGFLY